MVNPINYKMWIMAGSIPYDALSRVGALDMKDGFITEPQIAYLPNGDKVVISGQRGKDIKHTVGRLINC